jgi:hypothetical protein
MSTQIQKLVIEVDDLDYSAILAAIAKRQNLMRMDGRALLPDGEGDLRGRLLAEICRGWCEFVDLGTD